MVCAIASKWSTALVEPPRVITILIAFSKAFLVIISEGFILLLTNSTTAAPARLQSFSFASDMAS